jgi:hypothetical protein
MNTLREGKLDQTYDQRRQAEDDHDEAMMLWERHGFHREPVTFHAPPIQFAPLPAFNGIRNSELRRNPIVKP